MNDKLKMRESFVFYRSFWKSIIVCPESAQLPLFRAVADYALNQVEPIFQDTPEKPFVIAIWEGIKPQLDANERKRLNGMKGAEFGKLGGAPKGNKNASKDKETTPKQPQNEGKTTRNDNDNDNVNENVNVKDKRKTRKLNFPFTDEKFLNVWNELRELEEWKKRKTTSLQKNLDSLIPFDVEFAILLINEAIAGEYKRLVFESTPQRYQRWQREHQAQQASNSTTIMTFEDIYKKPENR